MDVLAITRRVRCSRWLPRLLWLASWLSALVSRRLAGRVAAALFYVPWQSTPSHRMRVGDATVGAVAACDAGLVADGYLPVLVPASAGGFATVPLARWTAGEAGPTVLLVHGWADRATSLGILATALVDAGYRIVAVDLPAHGDSPGLRIDGFALAGAVAQAARSVDARVVVAHSIGALATLLAVRNGLALHGVVLLAPVIRFEHALKRFAAQVRLPRRAHDGLRTLLGRRFGPDIWQQLALDRHVAGLNVPALVVHDRGDRDVPIDDARRLVGEWSVASLVETEGLGHRRILWDSEVVASVVSHVVRFVRIDNETTDHECEDLRPTPQTCT